MEFLNLSVVHVLLTRVMISSELTVSPSYSSFLVLENLLQVVLDFSPLFSELCCPHTLVTLHFHLVALVAFEVTVKK